jgi:hypothetical protein
MRGKKLTTKEKLNKRIVKALNSIRKLERFYQPAEINSACVRYTNLFRRKKNATTKVKELEKELAELKGKI